MITRQEKETFLVSLFLTCVALILEISCVYCGINFIIMPIVLSVIDTGYITFTQSVSLAIFCQSIPILFSIFTSTELKSSINKFCNTDDYVRPYAYRIAQIILFGLTLGFIACGYMLIMPPTF